MAEQPAVLKIARNIDRPTSSLYAKFIDLPIGNIIDAQGRTGAIDYRIKPVTSSQRATGPVLTVDAGPRDNLAAWMALEYVQKGDVLLIATGGYNQSSVIGDLFVGMAKNAGAAAIVTDGVVRDQEGIEAIGIPVFAVGISSNSPQKNGPGSVGLPIVLGGIAVTSGDIACADPDGVAIVRKNRIGEVAGQLDSIIAKEASMEAEVKSGKHLPGWVVSARETMIIDYID